jgi:hypothetical protein
MKINPTPINENELHEILEIIASTIPPKDFQWRLDGSANLKLQGIPATPKDVDIVTNKKGMEVFRDVLKKYIKKDFYNEEVKAFSLSLIIKNKEIEINYYDKVNINLFEDTKKIKWKGLSINILPLKTAAKFYKNIGRIEAHDKIIDFLSRN